MRVSIVPAAAATSLSRVGGHLQKFRGIKRFQRDDRGGVTVSYVLWTAFYVSLFTFVADVTFLLRSNAEMWHVAHDTARRLSVADLSAQEVEAFARDALRDTVGDSLTVTVETGEMIQVTRTAPYGAATIFGAYDRFDSGDMSARAVMRDEIAAMAEIEAGPELVADAGATPDG